MRSLINHKAVRELAKQHGKRVGQDFFDCLERHVKNKIIKACGTWDGQKKTLNAHIAGWVGIK